MQAFFVCFIWSNIPGEVSACVHFCADLGLNWMPGTTELLQ